MSTARARLLRYSLISLGVLVASILLILTVASLVLYTEAGSRRVTQALITRANVLEDFSLRTSGISGNLLSGLTLTDLALDIPAANISADTIRASWNPFSLLSGSFYLSELELTSLRIRLLDVAAADEAELTDPVSLLRIAPLPVNVAVGALRLSDMSIVIEEQTINIEQLALAASLNGQNLEIQDLELQAAPLALRLNLQAELVDDIPLLASVNWEYRGALFADYELAVGTAAVTGNLRNLTIQHELLAPEAIHSSGNLVNPLSATTLDMTLTHSTDSLRLPFAGMEPYLFDNVSLTTRWSGAELDMTLQSAVSGPQIPTLQLAADGSMAGSTLDLTQVEVRTGTGVLTTRGELDWSGPFASTFRFNLQEQSPLEYLTASVPMELTDLVVAGSLSFGFVDEQRRIALIVDDFKGTSSGYALSGAATINMLDDALQIQNLRLNTEANEIFVSGEYADEVHLNWRLEAPALAQLLSGIAGSASGSGQIDGTLSNPTITATLQVLNLQTEPAAVDAISLNLSGTRERLIGSTRIQGIRLPAESSERQIELVELQFTGNQEAHALTTALQSSYGNLEISLQGGIADLANPIWTGNLVDASLRSDFGNWRKQNGPSALTLSPAILEIAETCWQLATTGLCIDASRSGSEQIQFRAALSDFPLDEFNGDAATGAALIAFAGFPRLPQGLGLDGTVSASVSGLLDLAGAPPQVSFNLDANNAVLRITSTEAIDAAIAEELLTLDDQLYNWDTLSVSGDWVNDSWALSGDAVLSQQNVEGTTLGLNGVVRSNLAIAADGALQGTTTASFAELGWIQAFLPELTAVNGTLDSTLQIGGTLSEPLFAGELTLAGGAAELPRFGLSLTDIQSTVSAQSTGTVQLSGALNSGDGSLSFTGDFTDIYDTSRQLQASLTGSNFQLANIPDMQLSVTPELTLHADRELIQLTGSLDIPTLDLTLRELPETAVDVSRDVVVVSYPEDRPELARSFAANQSTLFDIPVAADINLTLGDAVAVAGFGMEATLDGDLAIQQRPDGSNLTYGELSIVEGAYEIYGQTLTLRQGKLLFFGAIDNPALDIRAVRETDTVTVGVLMNGTLKNISSQLYSTPVLSDNDIIAVLVTGRPFSELGEQDGTAVLGAIASLGLDRGEGLTDQIRDTLGLDTLGINSTGNINSSALTIGKYLTPDIFVRYGVGLFDRQSKVAIDYSLSERIMLQAESGQYQSIDVTYKVER